MQSENGILLLFYIFLSHGNKIKNKKIIKKGGCCVLSTSTCELMLILTHCNKIEDEEHFILECIINSKLRTDLFAILANENPNFMQFSSEQKLIYLLNPTTTAHVKIIGFYIIRSLELRTEVS